MPRFELSEAQGAAVLRYIDLIRKVPDIGVTSTEILIAVTGPIETVAREAADRMNQVIAGTEVNGRRLRFTAMFEGLSTLSKSVFAVILIGSVATEMAEDIPVFQFETHDAQKSSGGGIQLFSLVRPVSLWVEKLHSTLKTEISECRRPDVVELIGLGERAYCPTRTAGGGRGEFYSRWPLALPGIGNTGPAARETITAEVVFAKLMLAGLSRVASPPRRAAFVKALRSGEAFDAGGGIALRFRQDNSVGLDGFYIYRESGRGLERLWRPF